MRRIAITGYAALAVAICAAPAAAAENDLGRARAGEAWGAPAGAFEATLGLGYTQGFGQLVRGGANNLGDVADLGVGVDVGGSRRISPQISLGVNAQYHELSTGRTLDASASARGAAFDVNVQLHLAPYRRVDPWLGLGSGYRMLWQAPTQGPNHLWHGLQLVKAQAGVDFRYSSSVALGPVIGADLNLFLWSRDGGGANAAIADPRVNTFVYVGLQGRFDAGGTELREPARTVAKGF